MRRKSRPGERSPVRSSVVSIAISESRITCCWRYSIRRNRLINCLHLKIDSPVQTKRRGDSWKGGGEEVRYGASRITVFTGRVFEVRYGASRITVFTGLVFVCGMRDARVSMFARRDM